MGDTRPRCIALAGLLAASLLLFVGTGGWGARRAGVMLRVLSPPSSTKPSVDDHYPPSARVHYGESDTLSHLQACRASNELEQVHQLWWLSRTGYRHSLHRRFSVSDYTYEVATRVNTSEALLLDVREFRGPANLPSKGGTSFHATLEVVSPSGNGRTLLSLASCSTRDLFDGRYSICCPLPLHYGCGPARLIVQVDFVNFEIFQRALPGTAPRRTTIHNTTWAAQPELCPAGRLSGNALLPTGKRRPPMAATPSHIPECVGNLSQLSLEGEWAEAQGRLRWVHAGRGCVTPVPDRQRVAACMEGLDSVSIMGDSHLRMFYEWFLLYSIPTQEMLELGWGHHDTHGPANMNFYWSTVGAELARRLDEGPLFLANQSTRPLTERDVLVLDTGHWNLEDKDITPFITVGLPAVIVALEKLRADPMRQRQRILWVSTYPMPPHDERRRRLPLGVHGTGGRRFCGPAAGGARSGGAPRPARHQAEGGRVCGRPPLDRRVPIGRDVHI